MVEARAVDLPRCKCRHTKIGTEPESKYVKTVANHRLCTHSGDSSSRHSTLLRMWRRVGVHQRVFNDLKMTRLLFVVWSGWLLPHSFPPPPSASCLSFSVFLCVAGRAYWWERREKGWGRSQNIRRRESLVLYKSFNTLWSTFTNAPEGNGTGTWYTVPNHRLHNSHNS